MEINQLNELRNKMHRQFVNRQPADGETVKFFVGNVDKPDNKALLMKLIELVADKSNNALVLFDFGFDGVKVVEGGKEKLEKVTLATAEKFVDEYFAG